MMMIMIQFSHICTSQLNNHSQSSKRLLQDTLLAVNDKYIAHATYFQQSMILKVCDTFTFHKSTCDGHQLVPNAG